jgi:HrpA-like RNA helicase
VFLLEHAAAMCAAVKLAVAEPRRISATSVARRVGEELGDEPGFGPGALAGFAIRGESTVKVRAGGGGRRVVGAHAGAI